jgi:hypothetical protein
MPHCRGPITVLVALPVKRSQGLQDASVRGAFEARLSYWEEQILYHPHHARGDRQTTGRGQEAGKGVSGEDDAKGNSLTLPGVVHTMVVT